MPKTIATIGGVGLAPCVSKNRRWYKPEQVARAAERLSERIKAGDRPAVMLSFHGADDDTREISASLTSARLDDRGRLRYEAAIADTAAGRDIAALADPAGGTPHLRTVSIRGHWVGEVRDVTGPDGLPAVTGDDIEIDGIDFTKSPGVPEASIDSFAWAGDKPGTSESASRSFITESYDLEARVTAVTEDAGPGTGEAAGGEGTAGGDAAEAKAQTPAPDGTTYADPGYLDADGNQASKSGKPGVKRYPLNIPKRIRAAWSYIGQKSNAAQYTPAQLKRIRGKIAAAMKKIGATVTKEGWAIWPAEVAESDGLDGIAEYADLPGSFCTRASNGPLEICISSWQVDPADLDLILRKVADAATAALKMLDPDMDGDMDIPGADAEDTDGDNETAAATPASQALAPQIAGGGPPADDAPAAETAPEDPAAAPAAETENETEVPAMPDTATTETAAGQAPAAPAMIALTQEQFDQLLAGRAAPAPAAETAPAPPAAQAPAETSPAAPVTETSEQREARLAALADKAVAEMAAKHGLAVAETDAQIMERLIEERLVPLRQAAAERDGVQRKGHVDTAPLEKLFDGSTVSGKVLQEASHEELKALAGAAYGRR